jgi:predicted pyridoxine 5'-phosphate oxidase superfamily flavin-nucleotide-binding protein
LIAAPEGTDRASNGGPRRERPSRRTARPKKEIPLIPETLLEVLRHEGVVAIATQGPDGPHVVNTWNRYVRFSPGGRMLVPAGFMHRTEANLARDSRVVITLGSREVAGKLGPGTGFLVKGTAALEKEGDDFDATKAAYPWARAVLAVTVATALQTL